jgi:hypothetical protein
VNAFVPLLFLMLAPAPAPTDQDVLRGLHTVDVLIESMDSTARRVGFAPEEYRLDAVRRLRQAGLHVHTDEESAQENSPVPCLYLRVGAMVEPQTQLALYSVDLELMEAVFLEREPTTFTLGSIWQSRAMIGQVATRHVDRVRGNVRDAVDQFIDAWAAANPR